MYFLENLQPFWILAIFCSFLPIVDLILSYYSKNFDLCELIAIFFMITSPADIYEVVGMVCSLPQYFDISYRTFSHLWLWRLSLHFGCDCAWRIAISWPCSFSQPGCNSQTACDACFAHSLANSKSFSSNTTTFNSSQALSRSTLGGLCRFGDSVIQFGFPLIASTPLVSMCIGNSHLVRNASVRSSRLWCRGSPPVITIIAAPDFSAAAASLAKSSIFRCGCKSERHDFLVSHQWQPTLHPASRIKKLPLPAWIPSPWMEWNVSTTGSSFLTVWSLRWFGLFFESLHLG